ncbi:MAG: hypothetical protein ACHP79_10235, partial [Terriglobales bacterium]
MAVPVAAVLLAVRVKVELPVPGDAIDAGLKLAVTPAGKPDAESEIADANPFSAEVDTLTVPAVPCFTERLAGVALKLKSAVAAEVTERETVEVCVTPPPLAVMVTVEVPTVAVPLAVRVKVELPVPGDAMDAGLKLAVTPAGKPDAESEIVDANPFSAEVDTLTVPA